METKNGIKFYQVLVTDWHESSLDATYKHVFNYATLAEALRCPFYVGDDNKHVGEGEKFVDPVSFPVPRHSPAGHYRTTTRKNG